MFKPSREVIGLGGSVEARELEENQCHSARILLSLLSVGKGWAAPCSTMGADLVLGGSSRNPW